MHSQYRKDIDGLRALAVISVVIFHAFPFALPGGFVGVDIFFVISGYLISKILFNLHLGNNFSYYDFYSRRVLRIFPALLIVIFSCYAYGWFNLLADDFAPLGKHIAAASVFISNIVLWNESGYFDPASYSKILLHLWSLGVEEQFYIFYPLIVGFLYKNKLNLLKTLLIVILGSFAWNIYLSNTNLIADFYSPLSRAWELLIGSVIAYLHIIKYDEFKIKNLSRNTISILGFVLLLISFLFLNESGVFPGWSALLPVFGAGLLIFAGPEGVINKNLLSKKIFVWFGLISYPLYLWHWPIFAFSRIELGAELSVNYMLFLIGISILLAWLTYRFVEIPLRFKIKRKKIIVVILIIFMAIIGFVGLNCFQRGGIQLRHQNILKEFSSYQFDKNVEQRRGTCFAVARDGGPPPPDLFRRDCIDTDGAYKVVLWGDSQSASLYAGFRELTKKYDIAVSQFSIPGCGGVVALADDHTCDENRISMDLIKEIKPDMVVLHQASRIDSMPLLGETIKQLNALGTKVVVIGPTPHWKEDLPRIILRYSRKNHQLPPAYFNEMLTPDVEVTDQKLKKFVPENKASYFSAWDHLCNKDGCLILVPNTPNAPVSFDENHFTPAGAIFLIDKFGEIYFEKYRFK